MARPFETVPDPPRAQILFPDVQTRCPFSPRMIPDISNFPASVDVPSPVPINPIWVVVPLIMVSPATEKVFDGDVVPIPTFPDPSTIRRVAVEDPTTNSGTPEPSALGFTERSPHGVEDAIPRYPPLE